MLGGAYFRIDRIGGYGKRNIKLSGFFLTLLLIYVFCFFSLIFLFFLSYLSVFSLLSFCFFSLIFLFFLSFLLFSVFSLIFLYSLLSFCFLLLFYQAYTSVKESEISNSVKYNFRKSLG